MKKILGLTLIEVLIALAIVAIALTAIIKTTSQNIRSTAYLQDKTIASWVAFQVINEARVGLEVFPEVPGVLEKEKNMLGQVWKWRAYQKSTPNPQIREIHVEVSRANERKMAAYLVGYIYVP